MKEICVDQLLDLSVDLTAEKDGEMLLERILTAAMDITECDGGTLYICDDAALQFHLMITRSAGYLRGGRYGRIDLPPVPLKRDNACTCAVLDRQLINVRDVYASDRFDFSGPRRYDAMTGYRTKSMLVVPMEDDRGRCIGVLQLINALDASGQVIAFPVACERMIQAMTSLAAISLTNMNYAAEVQDLMSSLVGVMSTAIDARTPYNANHTRNMVVYGERFVDWLNASGAPWRFSERDKRQFLMAVWLHDVGKLTTPQEIMDKNNRLGRGYERVISRLEKIGLLGRIRALETGADCKALLQQLEQARALIEKANTAGFLNDELLAAVVELGTRNYETEQGQWAPWLTQAELRALSVRKGTLTEQERAIMESHVTMTARILSEVKFGSEYTKVAQWAGAHHEFLDGTGYPNGLTEENLSRETRLLTILDIFDALTARDRPYRQPMVLEKAMEILHGMARDGRLDGEILTLFEQSAAWEECE